MKTEEGPFDLDTPRDRDSSFEPKRVKKHQTRFTAMDDKILYLYGKGITTREIVDTFDEWYGAEISPTLISRATNAVIEQVTEWQSRPLDAVYPIVYLDCIVVKIRQNKQVINKSVFLALGINTEGQKEIMGMRLASDAINTVYSDTQIQLCIVHMVRNLLKFVPWKDYKAVTADLKKIYQS